MVYLRKSKVPRGAISFFILLFLLQFLFPRKVNSYNPVDSLAVSCGNTGKMNLQNRYWFGDVDTTLFSLIEPQTSKLSVKANASNLSPSVNQVPFGSARLSHSNFIYSFPVTHGPWFLRLHFYPTSYVGDFEPHNSFFSVKVGNFTLLKDFNPSLWVLNGDDTSTREFCINVETAGKRLNIIFLPSIYHSNAYAFINGIEIVSMPPFLYYTDPNELDPTQFKYVGLDTTYKLDSDKTLGMLYRIDVGGLRDPQSEDTGMYRNWESDPSYLQKQYPDSISIGHPVGLNYKNNTVANYTAPEVVYLTARNYGMHATENYNVTWEFEVDSEFTYMVRLHFCEFDYEIQHNGDRVFQIFIAETLAEPYADVIRWSGGNLVPTHRDYAVNMSSQGSYKKLNLTIKLQRLPLGKGMTTNYHDVILNGIEIFKISDENNSLAGPNPERLLTFPQSSKISKTTVVIISVVAVLGLVLSSVVGTVAFRWRRRTHDMDEKSRETKTEESSSPSKLCRYFTIADIRAATNNFDDAFIVGVGGFGNVYKGYIDGAKPVAIKRLKSGSQQGGTEFRNEIEMLSQLRHIHLVSLIGYCNDSAEMILVYDFMQRGTLSEYLYTSNNQRLPWKQRLEILLGAARGLHYLHTGATHPIIHRDVKSTNILLDENWVAKVSDLGLSKVGPSGISRTHVTTVVKGSVGYLDPEYYKSQMLTLKSDVYSFGVVLLEVLCGRPPIFRTMDMEKESLIDWVQRCYDRGEINQTVDPVIKDSISSECLKLYSEMALLCLVDNANQRPSMSQVVDSLESAIQLMQRYADNTQEEGDIEERPLRFSFFY